MRDIVLPYGSEQVTLDVSWAKKAELLELKRPADIKSIKTTLKNSLEKSVVGCPPLHELLQAEDEVAVIIGDSTRPWTRQDMVCGALVEYLTEKVGIPEQNIVVLVGVGPHAPLPPDELPNVAGTAFGRVAVINHDNLAPTVEIGQTSAGTVVSVNPIVIGRKVICVSSTVPHRISGYSGAPKTILPGISSAETIRQNLSLVSQESALPSFISMSPSDVENNLILQDALEAAEMLSPLFSINIMPGREAPCKLISGEWRQAWEESCRMADKYFRIKLKEPVDVVVASCGGEPKDNTLYQTLRTMIHVGAGVKDGGTLALVSKCTAGTGGESFSQWLTPLREGRLDQALAEGLTAEGYTLYAAQKCIERLGKVILLTELPQEDLTGLAVNVVTSADAFMEEMRQDKTNLIGIPEGSLSFIYVVD